MARDIKTIDTDLGLAEASIAKILGALGTIPAQGKNIVERITDLEKGQGRLTTDVAALNTRATSLEAGLAKARDKIKWNTYGIYALVTNALLVKIDTQVLTVSVQALKIDLSLFKKLDEKNSKKLVALHKATDRGLTHFKDFFFRKSARERKEAEAEKQREKAKEDAHEAEQKRKADALQRQVNALPPIVDKHGKRITTIEEALRKARDAANKAVASSTGRKHGVDSTKPTVKPVTQDVRALREAVNQLAGALGGI
ncbi:hypothetical protein ACODT3_14990 [Streptomyces sp. 4.24]|uniref:hypothetical protein n=1 Tax=Streptomyces tritrimontium TaxID=3406573 RepID=UPI003BB611B6